MVTSGLTDHHKWLIHKCKKTWGNIPMPCHSLSTQIHMILYHIHLAHCKRYFSEHFSGLCFPWLEGKKDALLSNHCIRLWILMVLRLGFLLWEFFWVLLVPTVTRSSLCEEGRFGISCQNRACSILVGQRNQKFLLIFYSHVNRTFLTVGKKNLKAERAFSVPMALICFWKWHLGPFRNSWGASGGRKG